MKSNETVRSLRNKGFKVKVLHHRATNKDLKTMQLLNRIDELKNLLSDANRELDEFTQEGEINNSDGLDISKEVSPRYGQTEVRVTSPSGKVFIGVAKCCEHDNYNKKLGVRKALGRALG